MKTLSILLVLLAALLVGCNPLSSVPQTTTVESMEASGATVVAPSGSSQQGSSSVATPTTGPQIAAAPTPPIQEATTQPSGLDEGDICNQPFPEGQRPPANCRYPKASRNLPEPVAIATDGPMDRCQVSVNRWIAVGQGSCLKSFMTAGVQISVFQGNGNANCTFFVRAYQGTRQLPTSGKLGCVSASDVRYDQGLVFLVGLNGEEVTLP